METTPLVTIVNIANAPQTRWVTVPLPASIEVPEHFALAGNEITGVRGPRINRRVQHAHLRLPMDGRQILRIEFLPAPIQPVAYKFNDAVLSNVMLSKLAMTVEGGEGTWTLPLLDPTYTKVHTIHVGPSLIHVNVDGTYLGWHWRLEMKLHSESQMLEWDLGVSWSDQRTTAQKMSVSAVYLGAHFPLTVYLGDSRGWHKAISRHGSWACNPGEWHDGVMLRASGSMRVGHNVAEYVTEGPEFEQDLPFWATAYWDSFGPGGRVPPLRNVDFSQSFAELDQIINQHGFTPWTRRMFGQGLATGDAGSQWPFGAFKDALAHANPIRAFILTHHTADDWCMRGHHHFDPQGRMVTMDTNPRWITWDGQTHTTTGDWLGKSSNRPWGWNRMPNGRLCGSDDQHRGDLPAWWVAGLYDCYPVVISRISHLHTDSARAKAISRQLDAPRASGRLWQSWAWAVYLYEDIPAGRLAKSMALLELQLREQQGDGWMWTVNSRNYIEGIDCAVPWHEALAVLGAVQFAHLLRGTPEGDRFQAWAQKASERLLTQAVAQNTDTGLLYPVNGRPANQPVVLTFPRVGVSFSTGTYPATDLIVGNLGWWDWWSGVIAAGKNSERVREVAERIWNQHFANGGGESKIGWASLPGLY